MLSDLREQIKSDPLPAAVLWVETTLRPAWVRRAEYIYWKVCTIVAHHRAMQMTVGLAQMKVWLWKEFLQAETHKTPTIADWENPLVNYYAVKWYLSQKNIFSWLDVSFVYTGGMNEYYTMLLYDALTRLS
jgi:hypothetical protein